MRRAAVIGAGSWGTAVAVLLARGGVEVQLGCRGAAQAAEIAASGRNDRYLPGVELGAGIEVGPAAGIDLAAAGLVCLAVPSRTLPAAVGAAADRVGLRPALLVLSKGLVEPLGALPSEYAGERIRARAVACLGGPAHAREAVGGGASLVLGSRDPELLEQLGAVFDRAGVVCERSLDATGVELAGVAKNAAALAAAAAEPFGLNAAGAAAASVWRECFAYALERGARPETFAGLAGVGDLTATMLAPGGRNRRAGALLASGTPAEEIRATIGQAAEALDSVPLLAAAAAAAGLQAPALAGLAALVEGRLEPRDWAAGLGPPEGRRAASGWG